MLSGRRDFSCGRVLAVLAGLVLLSRGGLAQAPVAAHAGFVRVKLGAAVKGPVSGRLMVFFKQGSGDKEVSIDEFHPSATWVVAREVHDLKAGDSVEIDPDARAFPSPVATLPAGNWEAQALLDPEHSFNYSGRGANDWVGPVVALTNWSGAAGAEPALILDAHPAESPRLAAAEKHLDAVAKPGVEEKVEFVSPVLSRFWGKPTKVRAWVVLPTGYAVHPQERYPTAYWTHGFGGNLEFAGLDGMGLRERMEKGTMPPMIWVMLDESCPQGTHEFANSVNDGPWGTALTTEFIPMLEKKYRMDAKPSGRLLNGHSSGGWATLQLQVNYPEVFGGTWSTSPDPSDFHDFTGANLYAPDANLYHNAAGEPTPIMRDQGKVVATMQQLAQLEEVTGPYGGQMASFDWVFSPKGKGGAPEPMFDRETGAVDPAVVAYWHEHWDLAHDVETHWAERAAMLKGRIHLIVGTADTFYLNQSAQLFEARLQKLGAEPHFTYLPGRTHFDLYKVGADPRGMFDQIGAEMYAVARPGSAWKAAQLVESARAR